MPQLTIPTEIHENLVRRAAALNVTVDQLVTPALERNRPPAPEAPSKPLRGPRTAV
jgi:hypothetical protein